VAYTACVAVQPDSGESDSWADAVLGIASITASIATVIALLAGARYAPALGVVAGIGMVAATFVYPDGYSHAFGWWTWVQAALAFGVLATSTVRAARAPGGGLISGARGTPHRTKRRLYRLSRGSVRCRGVPVTRQCACDPWRLCLWHWSQLDAPTKERWLRAVGITRQRDELISPAAISIRTRVARWPSATG
jgi:hypothetical protein